MVANSTDERAWLGWLTPFGWMDQLRPSATRSVGRWSVLVGVPVLLLVAAAHAATVATRRRAAGELRRPSAATARAPAAGRLRVAENRARARRAGWLGLGAYAFVMGTAALHDDRLPGTDENYQRVLADLGLGVALTVDGFVGVMGVILGVGFALYARLARSAPPAARRRPDAPTTCFARPVTRSRWLPGHAGLALVGAALLAVLTGLAMWAGAVATGSDG